MPVLPFCLRGVRFFGLVALKTVVFFGRLQVLGGWPWSVELKGPVA